MVLTSGFTLLHHAMKGGDDLKEFTRYFKKGIERNADQDQEIGPPPENLPFSSKQPSFRHPAQTFILLKLRPGLLLVYKYQKELNRPTIQAPYSTLQVGILDSIFYMYYGEAPSVDPEAPHSQYL